MKTNYLILGLLFSCLGYADVSLLNTTKSDNEYQGYVRISLNNQTNIEINTDSNLIPEDIRFIPAYGSAVFVLSVPSDTGMQHFRYINRHVGCDFYLDTRRSMKLINSFNTTTFVTGIPINSKSKCYVETIYGINHLVVDFLENNNDR